MNYLPMFAQAEPVSMWPFAVLVISVVFIVLAITKLRMHAFIALTCAALLAGWLSSNSIGDMVSAIGEVSSGFGKTAGGVGIVIALAAIIGMCLMESGAADQIVRRFMKIFGEERAGWALLASGFLLSIPVFFDTVFFLLVPLARMLGIRTGKNYMFYVLAIGGGGAITHSIVPPTPGPLLVGDMLSLDLGKILMVGLIAGIVPAVVGLWVSKKIDAKMPVPVRETPGSSLAELKASTEKPDSELPSFGASLLPVVLPAILLAGFSVVDLVEKQPVRKNFPAEVRNFEGIAAPSATIASEIEPVFLEISKNVPMNSPETKANVGAEVKSGIGLLDGLLAESGDESERELFVERNLLVLAQQFDAGRPNQQAIAGAVANGLLDYELAQPSNFSALHGFMGFAGNKIIALGLGALISILLLMKQAGISFASFSERCTGPLETAGVIILITSAGGAFGLMIQNTGIGDSIKAMGVGDGGAVKMLVLAWLVTAIIRIAQGSATVSMITGAGLMAAIIGDGSFLTFDPVYIFLAVGFGSITCSWMNDSGFWIVGKLSGFTERETLKSWTVLLTVIAVVGIVQTLIMAMIIPFPFGQ